MNSIWRSYIPYHVARDLVEHPAQSPIGRERRFDAVALFADVSGFTAISESLGKSGRSGTEELTTILNSYFEPMIALIHSYRGIIGKFGGDAMTVLFPVDVTHPPDAPHPPDAETRALVAHRAIQCALDMQDRMENYKAIQTSAGTFELAMKAGLAGGPVFCTAVGLPGVRLEYIIAGSSLDRCADAEHHASKGEVVVHDPLLEAFDGVVIGEKREGFSCVTGLASRTPPAPLPTIGSLPQQVVRTVSSFLHPAISQRIQEGLTSFINEHRKVVVLFVHFENLDYDDDLDVGEKLQDYFSKVIEIVHSYDGYLNKVDMGDKGSKYIVLFGAPIAHEDDVDRALYCALDLQEIPGAPVRIGINTGFVFCGQVGSPVRQEYTVMGDAVNLSARLMQAAQPGQLLMSEAVYAESEGFTWVNLPSIQVKGKTEEVVIRHLKGLKDKSTFKLQEPEYALPMVGREHELATAREKIERVLRGQGQIVGITAEAGMGKSRLGAEIIRLAMAYGLTPYGGECVSHGTNASYLVWQNLLRGFFELDPAWPLEDQAAHLQFQLKAINPNFVQRIPLLGLPLNQTIPDNELTQAMDAGLRKSSLEAMLVECIRHRAGAGPLLLVLEDCHWIDPLSNDLLETIGRNIIDVPALLLVIYRPSETERIQPKGRRFGHFTEISLLDFTEAEAARLIELKLRQLFDAAGTVPADLTARITERAQGNPFYIDEMINLIHDRGIDPADAQALEGIELPDSLHSLIISRIDQLHEGPKTTLKIASVIGRLFKADWLWGVYPQLGDPSQVKTQLEQLHQLEITPLDKPEPELEYLFKHILTREVAYESLAVATRTMLHGEIGAFIERTYPDGLDQLLNILAHHYGASDNTEKQREYFYKAGVAAQNAYANEAAIEYYQHLLHLFREEERIDVMLRLGQVWQITGRWSESENIFRKALKIAQKTGSQQTLAKCYHAIGSILNRKGVYSEAIAWLENARSQFSKLSDASGLSDVLITTGVIQWYQGEYDKALEFFEESQRIAKDSGNQKGVYRAIGNIGLIYQTRGEHQKALWCYHQAQEIAENLGDRLGINIVTGNTGNIYLEKGNYVSALEYYARGLQLALEIGYRQGVSVAIGNMGNIYWYAGDYATAEVCQTQKLQITLELGDRIETSRSASMIGLIYLDQGALNDAERFIDRAIALARALDAPSDLADFLFNKANLLNAQENPEEALAVLQETIRLAASVDNTTTQFEAQITSIRTQVQLERIDTHTAIQRLEALLETSHDDHDHDDHDGHPEEEHHEHDNDEQVASISYEIWKLDPAREAGRQRAADLYRQLYQNTPSHEFRSCYEELTGERLPDPPPLPPLPEIVTQKPVNPDTLLIQIDALIQEAKADTHQHHNHH